MTDPAIEALASLLSEHHPTRGMRVSQGMTCACGYWTGTESPTGRTVRTGSDQLDLHRAQIISEWLLSARTTGLVEGLREYADAVSTNKSAAAWGQAEFVADIQDWADAHEEESERRWGGGTR
jgi:hypothetical protein